MLLNKARALEVMERHGLDGLVATTLPNVLYLSDYGTQTLYNFASAGFAAAILPRDESKPGTLVIRELDLFQVDTWMPELRVSTGHTPVGGASVPYVADDADLDESERNRSALRERWGVAGVPNFVRLLGRTLEELGFARSRLAFDDARILAYLQEAELAEAESIDAPNVFREIRVVKTEPEIRLLREAARMNEASLSSVIALAGEGTTTGELVRHYRALMSAQGGYGSHIAGGGEKRPNSYNKNTAYRLKAGDHLVLDPAGWYEFYWADGPARSITIGDAGTKFEHLYGQMVACTEALVPMFRAGITSAEVEDRAREIVGPEVPHGFMPFLHSMGIEQYDHPQTYGEFFSDSFTFETGMLVNWEALYFELGWGNLNIEESYLIGPDGPERLFTFDFDAIAR